jgi:hypothetical protein
MRLLVAFVLIGVTGCSVGGETKAIDDDRVDQLVLQPADVGREFQRTTIHNLAADAVVEVRYRHVDPASPRRPLTIESSARVFGSIEAAEETLEGERSRLAAKPAWQPIGEPGLGDESFAATVVGAQKRSYAVFWRAQNATASLELVALRDRVPFSDVLELARKQDQRIADARSR